MNNIITFTSAPQTIFLLSLIVFAITVISIAIVLYRRKKNPNYVKQPNTWKGLALGVLAGLLIAGLTVVVGITTTNVSNKNELVNLLSSNDVVLNDAQLEDLQAGKILEINDQNVALVPIDSGNSYELIIISSDEMNVDGTINIEDVLTPASQR